jgi:predicted DNA-binding transcriptional regulator YafY
LRSIVATIRRTRSLKILYQSMNPTRPDPQWRWITPHAFGNDGLRWHVRAYCHIDQKFKDFLLSRCLEAGRESEPGAKASDDVYWNEFFEVVLLPNPSLAAPQQEVIAQDYNMVDGHVSIPVRKALLYYFQKRLRLDVPSTPDNLHETPVVIANCEAFNAALAEAMA